jgi:hypothetical protein
VYPEAIMKQRLCPRMMTLGLLAALAIATLVEVGCDEDDTTGQLGGGYGLFSGGTIGASSE